ncbi:MAG TPA: cation-translocating P-type ATPase [Saprospiraceae bacterium]|nr:cation-translocating P-type ATPase [Saprospiraceae bacterium]
MNFHLKSIEDCLDHFQSGPQGLSAEEAALRLKEFGPNRLVETKKKPAWLLFLRQFMDFMILVLILAAGISAFLGDLIDTIIILVIVLLNAIVGFVQEYRAEKAIDALKKMATIQAQVLRDGAPVKISSEGLVPGDIVLLQAGNAVPADLRLIESHSLKINESALTGESVAVDKSLAPIPGDNIPLGDRLNMAYKSTLVTNGRGKGLVVATAMKTEIGRIAGLLQEEDAATPLQKRMTDFSRKLSYLILLICFLLFGIGLLRGEDPLQMMLLSISLAVAAIPEALPALITIALAKGANRMARQNALIRNLPSVETLGSVNYICSDKTGTLTLNKMTVIHIHKPDGVPETEKDLNYLDLAMALNQDVQEDGNKQQMSGDPTELALLEYFNKMKGPGVYENCVNRFPRVAELPFDSERKCMSTIHRMDEGYLVFTKGAVESITARLHPESPEIPPLADEWSREGLRVLAFAYRILPSLPAGDELDSLEHQMHFLGMAGMIDPPREEAKIAIGQCKTAGIHTVMITGDHPETAAAIARQIGLADGPLQVMHGTELEQLPEQEFARRAEHIQVYARVNPEQKLKIVKALQAGHNYIAMTGDGVNDAPSLKAANIGVAMGINGTDVSKEAADMILLDDNFATIVKAVREGRRIYDNIRKFVKYILTCNGAEIWTIFLAPLIGLPIPLLAIHILWINLVTDGLPGLALASEKAERDIMTLPPRRAEESLFSGGAGYHIAWVGLLMAGITLGVQSWAISRELPHWQTMVFTVLSLSQLGHVLAVRSEREFLYSQGLFSNRPLLTAVFFTFLLQLAIIYLPAANEIFRTQALTIKELAICIGLSAIVFHAVELEKWIKQRNRRRPSGGYS